MSTVLLSHPSGSSADVYLNGAHVTSWIPAGGKEVLFMGKTATFAPGDPIRGGIPVVLPQFANIGPLPQHGFASKSEWQLAENADSSDDPSSVKLVLTDDHKHAGAVAVPFPDGAHRRRSTISRSQVKLDVFNTGDELFSFTAALHTYIAVADIRESAIRGFTGKWYLDKTQGGNETKDEAKKLVISDETDRVYLKAPKKVEVEDRGNDRRIEVRARRIQGCGRLESVGGEGDRIHRARPRRLSADGLRRSGADRLTGGAQARRHVERLTDSGDRVACRSSASRRSNGSATSAECFSERERAGCAHRASGRCATITFTALFSRSSRRDSRARESFCVDCRAKG